MHESLSTTAQLTLNRSFDVTSLQALRQNIKAEGPARGLPNITLNDMVVYATAQVLTRHPELNAHFLGDRVRFFQAVHIGVAVDSPRGLMVPVVRDAQAMDLSGISTAIKPLAEAAHSGSISPDHLQGGTFTLTNLGMMGIESFTPVLNTPEVGILGVCGIVPKPVMNAEGMVKHVPSINLSLTINHQVVDGSPAARFLGDLVDTLENFEPDLA
jgi:pyruvate dehydrogenase E2 component (dihydrolipoamide acetyltransferase)